MFTTGETASLATIALGVGLLLGGLVMIVIFGGFA